MGHVTGENLTDLVEVTMTVVEESRGVFNHNYWRGV